MKCIGVRTGKTRAELFERRRPVPAEGELLIKTIRAGVCGTDREIVAGGKPQPPEGEEYLILGHEALGRIEEINGGPARLSVGDYVVPLVRRGCGMCLPCKQGRVDYCFTGKYTERGILKQHGFYAEYFVERPEYLIKVSPELVELAVLLEPLSVAEKAMQVARHIQRRFSDGDFYSGEGVREKVLVAGHGPIGMLAMLLARVLEFEVYVIGRRPAGDPQREFIQEAGATYLNPKEVSLGDYTRQHGGFFIIVEATGSAGITFELVQHLGPNGVLVLTGVSRGAIQGCTDVARLMRELVLNNQVIVGSVNACRGCFQQGLAHLGKLKQKFPRQMDEIITHRYQFTEFEQALREKSKDQIKVVLEFGR
jgi:threonine dehydrogenase-like Zn-dependent dehydrogenase